MDTSCMEIENGILKKYTGHDLEVIIPEGVTEIAAGAFRDAADMKAVRLPYSLKTIREEAFQWCRSLEYVAGGDNVTRLERDAFQGTAFYKFYDEDELNWEGPFRYIGKVLFKAKRTVRKAFIPDGTVAVAADAFTERVLLSEVEFPPALEYIGWRAFSGCTGLFHVHIPGTVKTLGWHCFRGCSRLYDIQIDEGVENIEIGAFASMRSLRSISFPRSLKKLGGWTFFMTTISRMYILKAASMR